MREISPQAEEIAPAAEAVAAAKRAPKGKSQRPPINGCEATVEPEGVDPEQAAHSPTLQAALDYITWGWAPVPIPFRKKSPIGGEWQHLRITAATAPEHFDGKRSNIGVLLGFASGGLTDVDLDCTEAVLAAPFFLPRTRTFGRASRRMSHWLFNTDLCQTVDKAAIKYLEPTPNKPGPGGMLAEIRIGGGNKAAQTVFPGSTHEGTAEAILWEDEYPVATTDGAALIRACERIASVAILARHFPGEGARNETALTIGGFLSRCGFDEPEAKVFAEALCVAAEIDHKTTRDIILRVADTIRAALAGRRMYGFPHLKEMFGETAAKKCAEWLHFTGSTDSAAEVAEAVGTAGDATDIINVKAHYDTADMFQDSLPTPLLRHGGAFSRWDGPAWSMMDEETLRAKLYAFLNTCRAIHRGVVYNVKPEQRLVDGVLHALRARALIDTGLKPPVWLNYAVGPPAQEIISCANGLLHMPSRRLFPHSPDLFNVNAVDFNYDPAANAPLWLEFLRQLWPNDQQSIDTLQEIFGYLLTTDTRQQKAFGFIGPSRSGKGTTTRVLQSLIGERNFASPTLASLGLMFGEEDLIGKQVAFVTDARASRFGMENVVERLLAITGEDTRTVQRKNEKAWNGKIFSRLVMLMNELPKFSDASGAAVGRIILLEMTESFIGREDVNLTAKLIAERAGILNWAIAGLERLTKRGHFVQPTSALGALRQLQDLSNPVGAFVRDNCTLGNGFSVEVDRLYAAYRTWCESEGRDYVETKEGFGSKLRAGAPRIKKIRPRAKEKTGGRKQVYLGIRLKEGSGGDDDEPEFI